MKILIVIATDQYVRNTVTSGAFAELERRHDVAYVLSEKVQHPEAVERAGRVAAVVSDGGRRAQQYRKLAALLLATYRKRSRTMAHKFALLGRRKRLRLRLHALPGVRTYRRNMYIERAGVHEQLAAVVAAEAPDLIIAPSGGIDALAGDAVRIAADRGIPSMIVVHNWDNVSSKGAFAIPPDYLAVWGEQSAEHAQRIHGFPAERIRAVGAPSLDHYFRHVPGSTESRFPFRYALFAGCYQRFDELTPLRALERTIEEQGLDIKVVYRPHPHRRGRLVDDRFDPAQFRHVVLDPEVATHYARSFESHKGRADRKPVLPPLDSYPSLFEHAECVICPLSTMIVEAAIFETPVVVVAYDDGIHPNSPAQVLHYDHFEGVDRIEGFAVVRELDQLPAAFTSLLGERDGAPSLREQTGWWLHADEHTYAERLADWVDELGIGAPRAVSGAVA